jgi:hypothetical protein
MIDNLSRGQACQRVGGKVKQVLAESHSAVKFNLGGLVKVWLDWSGTGNSGCKYEAIMNNHPITFKIDLMVIKDVANFPVLTIDRGIARWYNSTIDIELHNGECLGGGVQNKHKSSAF